MAKSELLKLVKELENKKNKIEVLNDIPPSERGFVLLKVDNKTQKAVLNKLKKDEIKQICHYLDPDEVEDLLEVLKKRKQKKILEELKIELKTKTDFFFKFYPRTAAGMMNIDYIEVPSDATVDEVYEYVEKHVDRTGKEPVILAVNKGELIGEVPIHKLMITKEKEITNLVSDIPSIKYDAKHKKCLNVMKEHPHGRVVVYDDDESIIGIIYARDLLDAMHKKTTHDLYGFAGVNRREDMLDSMLVKIKYRYKWLILNLFTAFLAAAVIGLFQDTISKYVILAVYLPVVAGMGGNAGTQTLAVVIRGLSLKEIEKTEGLKVMMREMGAGIANGALTGALVAVVAYLINGMWMLGLVVWASLIINLGIAGTIGTLMPVILDKLGSDPASSSTVFITTVTDVIGFFVFLLLATLFLI